MERSACEDNLYAITERGECNYALGNIAEFYGEPLIKKQFILNLLIRINERMQCLLKQKEQEQVYILNLLFEITT